jgi:hypothetical protein
LINTVTSAKSIYKYNYIINSYGVLFCGTKSQCLFLWNAPFLSARKGRLKFFEDGLHSFWISVLRKWPARSSCQGNTARQCHWEREREREREREEIRGRFFLREWLCLSTLRDFKLPQLIRYGRTASGPHDSHKQYTQHVLHIKDIQWLILFEVFFLLFIS